MNKSILTLRIIFLTLLFGILVLFSCRSKQGSPSVPQSISDEIQHFSQTATCADANVKEMRFQNGLVYVFDDGTCFRDKDTRVLDEKGRLLGSLGGFTGNTTINGQDFSSATLVRVIWKK